MIEISRNTIDLTSVPGLEGFEFTKVDTPTFLGKDLLSYGVRLQIFPDLQAMVDTLLATTGSVYVRDCWELGGQYHMRWAVVTERPLDLVFDLDVKPGIHHEFLTPVYNINLAVNRENINDLLAAHGRDELERQLAESISKSVSSIVNRIVS